jgi:uncharacterized protein (TIGR02001 family)
MKFFNKRLLVTTCAALVASSAAFMSAAHADELTAAAGVASAYYWRGLQVSNGAQVWGELTYTIDSGFYGDLWASSEGFGVGPEYDLSAGWSGKFGDFGVNVGAVTYVYSADQFMQGCTGSLCLDDNDPGDFSDVYAKFSYGPAFLNVYHNVALMQGQDFVNAGFTWEKFTFTVGYQKFEDDAQLIVSGYNDSIDKVDYTYADVTFAATKNLSITVSGIIDGDDELEYVGVPAQADTNRTKVIVAYSLPITF